MCFRGSHDCSAVTSFNDVLTSAPATVLSSYVWLCKSCKESSIPIKPRKSKSRHDSIVNKSDSVSQQLKEDSIDSQISSSQEITDHSTLQSSAAIDNSDLHEKSSVAATERICEKYKRGKCPHGLKGKKKHNGQICEFEHPKYCNRFCRYGKQLKFGCSKGPDCKFLLPELCKFSVKNKLCTKSDCTFIHLKGTRRQTNNSAVGHKKGKAENKKSDPSKGVTKANQDQDFLELRRLLETMQTRIGLLSEIVDNSNALPLPQTTFSSTSSARNSAPTIPLLLPAVPTASEDTRAHYSSCLVLNVQSMNPSASSTSRWKVPEISALIQKEKSKNHSLSFIALTETWLKSYMSDAQLQIPGYSVSRSHRDARLGGGVLLYSHVNLVSAL